MITSLRRLAPAWLFALSLVAVLSVAAAPRLPAQFSSLPPIARATTIPFEPLAPDLHNVRGANYIPSFAASGAAILSVQFTSEIAQIELDLWNMRHAGINTIRFWLNFWSWAENPTYYLAAIEFVLQRCELWGIHVIPILWDGVFEARPFLCPPEEITCPLQPPCLRPFQQVPTPWLQFSAWFPNPGAAYIFYPELQSFYDPFFDLYVNQVVNRLEPYDSLFMWDIMNEPISGCWPELDNWLFRHIAAVRQLDPGRPITVGIALAQHQTTALVSQLDVVSFHPYTTLKEGFLDFLAQARAIAGEKPVLATEGLFGPGAGARYEDFLRYAEQQHLGLTLFEAMRHTNSSYAFYFGTGFLYPDGETHDLEPVAAFQGLAARQGGYFGGPFTQKQPSMPPAWVPYWPLGSFGWEGVGGPEIVSLLRHWNAQYGVLYPALVATTTVTYRHIVASTFGSLESLGVPTAAEETTFEAHLASYDTAVGLTPPDLVTAEQELVAMKDLLLVLMGPTRGNIGNQQ